MPKKVKRFIVNKYDLGSININNYKDLILDKIKEKEQLFDSKCPPTLNKSIDSLGEKIINTSFYDGTGGNIYLYWRQYLFYKKSPEYLKKFQDALETNLNIVNSFKKNHRTNSFFMGDSGIYLFCCIFGIETKNNDYFIKYFNKLIDLKNLGNNKQLELELLYGITGYLYSLLMLKKYLLSVKKVITFPKEESALDEIIKNVYIEIIDKGIDMMIAYNWKKCLLYPFPLNDKDRDFYLGAAHGLIGVIYILLSTIKFYPKLLEYEDIKIKNQYGTLKNLFKINLNYIKDLQIKLTGNFPDDIFGKDIGDKTYFCHGCVGAVYLFLLADALFPGNNFKNVALKCNKSLWERGLLYKGNGICHGMSGICYALMKLYLFTNDELYLKSTLGIAYGTIDPNVQKLISEYTDPQRLAKGIPDTPYSLMEGDGGLLIMYYDLISLLNKDNDCMIKILPGYEIF